VTIVSDFPSLSLSISLLAKARLYTIANIRIVYFRIQWLVYLDAFRGYDECGIRCRGPWFTVTSSPLTCSVCNDHLQGSTLALHHP
jgi:hypothetical protein